MNRLVSLLASALALAAVAGCGSRVIDLRTPPDPDPLPAPASPADALLRLRWAWTHRDPAPLRDLLAADYRFEVAADTARPPLFRQAELEFAERLLVSGTATRPAAETVALELVRPGLQPGADPRRRRIVTGLHLGVRVPDGEYRVISEAVFTLARGDVARIPQELLDEGYAADSTRWWIERWEERTAAGSGSLPEGAVTVAALKGLYLDLGSAPARR